MNAGATAPEWDSLTNADVGLGNVANVDQQNADNITSGTLQMERLDTGGTWSTTSDLTVSRATGNHAFSVSTGDDSTAEYKSTSSDQSWSMGHDADGDWRLYDITNTADRIIVTDNTAGVITLNDVFTYYKATGTTDCLFEVGDGSRLAVGFKNSVAQFDHRISIGGDYSLFNVNLNKEAVKILDTSNNIIINAGNRDSDVSIYKNSSGTAFKIDAGNDRTRIGDVAGFDYMQVAGDGEITLAGDARVKKQIAISNANLGQGWDKAYPGYCRELQRLGIRNCRRYGVYVPPSPRLGRRNRHCNKCRLAD